MNLCAEKILYADLLLVKGVLTTFLSQAFQAMRMQPNATDKRLFL